MIERGQVYRSARPARSSGLYTRIKVTGTPVPDGCEKVNVVTLTVDGRELRPRSIGASQLHEGRMTDAGDFRSTGYVLER